ncbi:MAG: TraB/GumN family protein [Ignavibacteria bacterium]|jgi:uncharacterized protein YbaP (TraB family)|nr:TraB/GumN family protein [Ignavibacteria bacterium]
MKKVISLQFVLILLMLCNNSVSAKPNQDATKPSTLLWAVSPIDDDSKVLYLLGSIHIATKDMYPLNPIIMNAWNESNTLGVEINLSSPDFSFFGTQPNLMEKFMNIDATLNTQLPPDVYAKLRSKMLEVGVPDDAIDYYTPLGAIFTMELSEMAIDAETDIDDFSEGIDQYFIKLADIENREVVEMESIERQILVLDGLSEQIVPYITYLLDNKDNSNSAAEVKKLFTAWSNGNIETIEKLINTPFAADKEVDKQLKNVLIYQRNIEIAAKLEGLFADTKKYFIVLGAGHLIGNDSIIDILQKTEKYKITRK